MRNARVLIAAVVVAAAFSAPLPAWGQCDPVGLIDALIAETDVAIAASTVDPPKKLNKARDFLDDALARLDLGEVDNAIGKIEGFQGNTDAALTQGEISQEDADTLIEFAQIIIDLLNLPDCVNDGSPVAVDDTYGTPVDTFLAVDVDNGLLVNDFDPDLTLPPLTVSSPPPTASTAGGTVVVNADGSFDYTPPDGFVGNDTFEYFVEDTDGQVSAAPGTVTIIVSDGTDVVVAFDDAYDTAANSSLSVSAPSGLLLNDFNSADPAPHPPFTGDLTVVLPIDDTGLVGTVAVDPDGGFVYTPPVGVLNLVTSFTYIVENAASVQDTATVTITVFSEAVPLAVDDFYAVASLGVSAIPAETEDDPPIPIGLLANDEGLLPLTVTSVDTSLTDGVVTFTADGGFTYDPQGFLGITTFTYLMQDKDFVFSPNPATVTLTVFAVPVAVDDQYAIGGNPSLSVLAANGLLDNDTDSDDPLPNPPFNDELSVASFDSTSAQGGTVVVNPDGSFTYTAPSGVALDPTDTFAYFAQDATGLVSLGTPPFSPPDGRGTGATVTITGINRSPTAEDVLAAATEEVGVVGNFVANDPDDVPPDFDPLMFDIVNPPSEGSANVVGNTFVFDPESDFLDLAEGESRVASFDYQATDSHGAVSNTATVRVAVTGVDAPPIAQNVELGVVGVAAAVAGAEAGGVAAATVDGVTTACFDADDPDSNDDPATLTYEILLPLPAGFEGTVALGPVNGTFVYTAPAPVGVPRDVSFDYEVTSANAVTSNVATVTIGIDRPAGAGVWYVDNNVAGPGTGTELDPFNSLAPVNGPGGGGDFDGPGDTIILIGGGAPYVGALELEDNQELIGQGVAPPTITNPAGTGIVLGRCNTVQGVTVQSPGGVGIEGASVGIATIDDVTVELTGGDGIRLVNTAHAVTITNSLIRDHPNGDGIRIVNSTTSMSGDIRIGVDDMGNPAPNTFSESEFADAHLGAAIHIVASGPGHTMTALVQDNTIVDQGDFEIGSGNGILVEAQEEANIAATITFNAITDRAGDNIGVHASTGGTISVLIADNVLTGNGTQPTPTGSGTRESAIQIATFSESTGLMRVANIDIVNGVGALSDTNDIIRFSGTGVHEPIKIIVPTVPDSDCIGETCGMFVTPCNLPNDCTSPVCGSTVEGGGVCVEGRTSCGSLDACTTSADCPVGGFCIEDSCCPTPVCVLPVNLCPETGGESFGVSSVPEAGGPTIGGL